MDEESSYKAPDYVPSWWERGRYARANHTFDRSPTRVLAFYVVMALVGLTIIALDVANPHRLHGYWGIKGAIGAVLLLPIVVVYAPRAWKARQAQRRDR
ncbi:MAG TPA: hypothetical protein VHT27_04610 [Solirubrobacteraceae bacterium]|jgi:hypothetical protein|nr:hypothetical protein [Solirubrobacteraceae bacterium]